MRRSALAFAPLLALALVAGCAHSNSPRGFHSRGADFGESGAATNTPTDDPRDVLDSCVVGSWAVDPEQLEQLGMNPSDLALFKQLGATPQVVFAFKKNGDYTMDIVIAGAGTQQGISYSIDGKISFTGSWSASGADALTITTTDVSGYMTTVVGGQTDSAPVNKGDLGPSDFSSGTVSVTCSSSTLEMESGPDKMTLARR
ncbi:MAG: hypothetical protein FWF02_11215 [Micrococcales bacterium]|nr:hypothetical protein [Micrococcales bacterium]MCL2668257.1 hypothetical protein [Micrococcales bacterium]